MLNLGFRTVDYFSNDAKKRQNILFSATMTDEVDAILNDYFGKRSRFQPLGLHWKTSNKSLTMQFQTSKSTETLVTRK
jgi:superfamily II DNA/RNA helicase